MISINRFPFGFERDGKMIRYNENKTALLTSTLPEMGQIKGRKLSLVCHVFMRGEGTWRVMPEGSSGNTTGRL